tara:strand:- start:47 stop:460 length:414 start_codon:yes stop_codon:yes gene_type:complete
MLEILDALSIRFICIYLREEKYKLLLLNKNVKYITDCVIEEFRQEVYDDAYVYDKLYEEIRLGKFGKKFDLSLFMCYLCKNAHILPKRRFEVIKRGLINKLCLEKKMVLYFPLHHQIFIYNDTDKLFGKEIRRLLLD